MPKIYHFLFATVSKETSASSWVLGKSSVASKLFYIYFLLQLCEPFSQNVRFCL